MILQLLDHPHIISLYEIYEDEKYIHMVTEECDGGSLDDMIDLFPLGMPEVNARKIMWQICSAVSHMHASSICHRDLKPGNILF